MAIEIKPRGNQETRITVSFSDSISLIRDQVDWTPQGVSLLTKWHFAEGLEVEFAFDHRGQRHGCTGIVVACRPLAQPPGRFQTILYFVERPCPTLQQAACDCHLAREQDVKVRDDSRPVRSRKTGG